MVDFELYRIFAIVAKEENLTKASEVLNISQPAVTKRIHNLENELNTRLFDRSKSGMKLTSKGKKLYDKINESVITLENAERLFNDVRQINIGTRAIIFSRLFGASMAKFYKKYPDIDLKIEYLKTEEIIEKLKSQKIDIAIYRKNIKEENEDISFIKLGEIHDVFFVNNNYYREINKKFSKEDIKNEIIYISDPSSYRSKSIIKALDYSDEEKKNIKYIRNTTMLEMLKTEKGIGTISKEFIEKEIEDGVFKVLNTDFELPVVDFGIYYNKRNRFKELNSFIKLLKQEFLD